MYKRLRPHVNQFICLRQGPFQRTYVGRLVSVDPECVELMTFYEDGTEAELWTIAIATITEFSTRSRIINTLALKVKWANSHHEGADGDAGPAGDPARAADAEGGGGALKNRG